jgi:2-polyprenyl-6-hydroxyphenyl methylase/3-demethylubiquinone-9 3-methyltransferase
MPTGTSPFTKPEVEGIFDREAGYYSDERGASPYFQAQLKVVREMLPSGGELVLDLGCAAGAEIESLLNLGFRVVGIDYSAEMLRFARRRYVISNRVKLCRADAESLPFASASFDLVVCLGVFEYLPSYGFCLDEIHRVLRPGGIVIISVPTRFSLDQMSYKVCSGVVVPVWRAFKRLLGKRSSGQPLGRPWNRCNPWRFPSILREHGFTPERSAYSNFFLFPLGELWPRAQFRLFSVMERFSNSRALGWMLTQYIVRARKAA